MEKLLMGKNDGKMTSMELMENGGNDDVR